MKDNKKKETKKKDDKKKDDKKKEDKKKEDKKKEDKKKEDKKKESKKEKSKKEEDKKEENKQEEDKKDKMENSIKKYGKTIFEKYLTDKDFNEEKASISQGKIIDDILNYCNKNYTNYNFFIISFLSSSSSSYNSSACGIFINKTDNYFSFNNGDKSIYHIEIRIFYFINKLKPKGDYNVIENKIIKKNLEIHKKILDEKKYSFKSCDEYINLIPSELTDFILEIDKSRYYYSVIYLYDTNKKDWLINYKFGGNKPINSKIIELYSGENIEGISYTFSW